MSLNATEIERQRFFGCEIISEGVHKLKLSQIVCITGQSIFHHFYNINSFQSYDPFTVALGCLLLGSKIEEEPQIIRTIARIGYQIYIQRNNKDKTQTNKKIELEVGSKLYNNWKEEIINMERLILKDVGFSFDNNINIHSTSSIYDSIRDHPHRFILFLSRCVQLDQEVTQVAWNYLNDSMHLDLCIRYKPIVIAAASIHLAALYKGINLPDAGNNTINSTHSITNSNNLNISNNLDGRYGWWEIVDITYDDLLTVANEIMALYSLDLSSDSSNNSNSSSSSCNNSSSGINGDKEFVCRCRWMNPMMTVKYLDDSKSY